MIVPRKMEMKVDLKAGQLKNYVLVTLIAERLEKFLGK